MPQHPSRRFYLADLVAAVVFCGALAAMSGTRRGTDESNLCVLIMTFVVVGWLAIRSRRNAPTCDECGRRFSPTNPPIPVVTCPHCGEPQTAFARSLTHRGVLLLVMLAVSVVSVIAAIALDRSNLGESLEWVRRAGVIIASVLAVLAGLSMVWLAFSLARLRRTGDRPCEVCHGVIPADRSVPSLCPRCLSRLADRDRAAKEQPDEDRIALFIIAGLAFLAVYELVRSIASMSQSGNWGRLPGLVMVTLMFGLAIGFLTFLLILFRRRRRLLSDDGLLAYARQCAGEEGTVVENGPTTIWYSGTEDPVPMLHEEMAASHRRFECLLGETEIADPPIRILAFHDRDALLRFGKELFLTVDLAADLAPAAGIHLDRPFCILVVGTRQVADRLDDPRAVAGSVLDAALIEQVYGTFLAPWVRTGVARALMACGRPGELVRLNRKMVAALSVGAAWSEELFSISAARMSRLLQEPRTPKRVRKVEQFGEQAWSIVEYLGGERAPEPRRTAFRAFLKDKRSKSRQAESFFQHFGFGFGSLLDAWRESVIDRGIGLDEPPLPRTRDGILHRVLPVIRDRQARRRDRIQAIRDWRRAGFAIGADALIDLLHEPRDIPKEEIVWALRMVSGMAWSDEPERWQTWWDDLPQVWDEPSVLANARADGQETAI
jgi:hypothetical protein